MATLIDNLNKISACKTAINGALCEVVGEETMKDVAFEDYADIIKGLQLPSDDPDTPSEPSTPTPSADYIYSNGYITGGDATNDIITFIPYEIVLDGDGKYIVYLTSPEEIPGYDGGTYYDVVLTVDVPTTYKITNFELYAELLKEYVPQAYKENPRHSTVVREGVTYNSYVRASSDGLDIGSADVQYDPLQYRITIEKK